MFAATAIGSDGSDWPHGRHEASDRGSWISPADASDMRQRRPNQLRLTLSVRSGFRALLAPRRHASAPRPT
jgi:hypothetical protein